jgi:AcrR family transcriptional regulator
MERIDQPRNERSRRTRAALLDATWQLLEEQGAEQATMGAVAARAGVSRRALYLHFSSRAELLLALHEHVDEVLDLEASLRPVRQAPDPTAALEAFVAHLAGFHSKIMRIDAALLRAKDSDPDVAQLVDRGTTLWHQGCRRLVQALADAGQLAEPWTVDTAADLLWTFMFPDVLERLTVDRAWPLDRYQHLLTALLRRTLTKGGG